MPRDTRAGARRDGEEVGTYERGVAAAAAAISCAAAASLDGYNARRTSSDEGTNGVLPSIAAIVKLHIMTEDPSRVPLLQTTTHLPYGLRLSSSRLTQPSPSLPLCASLLLLVRPSLLYGSAPSMCICASSYFIRRA